MTKAGTRLPNTRRVRKLPRLELRESVQEGTYVLHLEGELDFHLAAALRAVFRAKASARCPVLVADITGVEFIDSTGIAVLIEYLREATEFGGYFCLAGAKGSVAESFRIAHLERAIPIYRDLQEAQSAARCGNLRRPEQLLFRPRPGQRSAGLEATATRGNKK